MAIVSPSTDIDVCPQLSQNGLRGHSGFAMAKAPPSPLTPLALTPADLEQITRRDRPTAQARIMRLLGIPFVVHKTDDNLIVSRAAAEAVLGAPIRAATV